MTYGDEFKKQKNKNEKRKLSKESHLTIKTHKLHGREGVGYSAVDLLPDQIVRPQQQKQ